MSAIQQMLLATSSGVSTTYASLNPLDSMLGLSLSNGNLTLTRSGGTSWASIRANSGKSTGKFVFEVTSPIINMYSIKGICDGTYVLNASTPSNTYLGTSVFDSSVAWGDLNGLFYNSGGDISQPGTAQPTEYYTHMIAVDATNKKAWIKSNQDAGWAGGGSPATGTNPTWTWSANLTIYPGVSLYSNGSSVTCNFGTTNFANIIPPGFSAWTL